MQARLSLFALLLVASVARCGGGEAARPDVVGPQDAGDETTAADVLPTATPDETTAADVPPEDAPETEDTPETVGTLCPEGRCDDGDPCNGREGCDPTTGACLAPPAATCPAAPDFCDDGGAEEPVAGILRAVPADGFRLTDEDEWAASAALLDAIVADEGVETTSLDEVLREASRVATAVAVVPGTDCVAEAFGWDAEDGVAGHWYPQGITGARVLPGGTERERPALLVSWYHKPDQDPDSDADQGARVTLVGLASDGLPVYAHLLLVHPVADANGHASFEPVPVHAGGMAWVGDLLYVADTKVGLRVFDLRRVLRLLDPSAEGIGWDAGTERYAAFGQTYILSQRSRYRLCESSCCARFSFVAVDHGGAGPGLLAGEYHASQIDGRLHRWPLDPDTGRLGLGGAGSPASHAWHAGVPQLQGALRVGDTLFLTSSRTKATPPQGVATLFVAREDEALEERRWAWGPEDLFYDEAEDAVWSLTEHPGFRHVFRIPRQALIAGCAE